MTETNNVDSIWRQCSEDGKTKPWFVISVIGDTTSIVPSTWEKSGFQSSLIDTAKGAKGNSLITLQFYSQESAI